MPRAARKGGKGYRNVMIETVETSQSVSAQRGQTANAGTSLSRGHQRPLPTPINVNREIAVRPAWVGSTVLMVGPRGEERQGHRRGVGFRETAAEKRADVVEITSSRQIGKAAEGDERDLI